MKLTYLLTLILSGLISALATAAESDSKAEEWIYSVRPGDTIWSICAQYIDEPLCWQKVGPYNGIELPRRLPPGSVLKIPVRWLKNPPAPVLVKELKGQVFWQQSGSDELLPLSLNHALNKGDAVVTEDGQLLLEFADGAVMQVEKNTRLVFDRLRYIRGSKSLVDTYLRLNRGAAQTQITPGRHQYKFQIDTPAGIAAVRGTEFRTQLQSQAQSLMTEVLTGRVGVSQGEQEVAVDAGFGLVSTAGQALQQPEKLLPAAMINSAAKQAAPVELNWAPVDGASAYRLKLKRLGEQTAIEDVVLDDNRLQLPELADGRYHFSVQAIANSGLQGRLASLDLEVVTPLSSVLLERAKLSRQGRVSVEFKSVLNAAAYRLEYSRSSDFSQALHMDLTEPMAEFELAKKLEQGQTLYLRARAKSSNKKLSEWSETWTLQPQSGTNWLAYVHIALAFSIFLL